MAENITAFPGARVRAEPWFSRPETTRAMQEPVYGLTDVMKSPAEVCIWAALAAHNAKTLNLGWLRRGFDEGRGDWVTVPVYANGVAVVYVDESRLVVCDPSDSATYSISTEVIYSISVETPMPVKPKEDCSDWAHEYIHWNDSVAPDQLRPRKCRLGDDCKVYADWAVLQADYDDPEVCENCIGPCDQRLHDVVVTR